MWNWLIAAAVCVVLIDRIVGLWVLIPLLAGLYLHVHEEVVNLERRENQLLDKISLMVAKRDRVISDMAKVAVAKPELEQLMMLLMDRLR
jgi:hypothetical protein